MVARPQLIRFVVHRKHWRSGERCGLFQAINDILGGEEPQNHLQPALLELAGWFDANLRSPFRSETTRVQSRWWRAHQSSQSLDRKIEPETRSISWIKETATEHVTKLYHLKALIQESGWLVDELRTTKPGEVLYEDEFQVVAIPFADTPT